MGYRASSSFPYGCAGLGKQISALPRQEVTTIKRLNVLPVRSGTLPLPRRKKGPIWFPPIGPWQAEAGADVPRLSLGRYTFSGSEGTGARN